MGKIQYEIISVIKQSNKGSVYLAKVAGYEFPAIVKKLKHGNKSVFETLQTMPCAYIPQIYQVEETDEGLLVVEEYIEGELLSEYLQNRALTEFEYVSIAQQLCEALKVLHNHVPPVIHRDVKPSNVIINSQGRVKLIDFDSSRVYKEESDSDTRLLGTEKYAAPEQYGFSQTDRRSDIYSLGVVLGMFPKFRSTERNRRWKKIVETCTLFAPESRYQTVEEVQKELKNIERAEGNLWKKIGIAFGVLLLLCIGGIAIKAFSKGKEKEVNAHLTATPAPTSTTAPTPTVAPTLTPTPKPTPTPKATPTSKPTPTPVTTATPKPEEPSEATPGLLPVDLGMTVVRRSYADYGGPVKTADFPECREEEGEPLRISVLKKQIANSSAYVQYYFKDRMQKADLLTSSSVLDDERESFIGVVMYSYQTSEWMRLSDTEAREQDGICHIDGQYMDDLPEGFYQLVIQMKFEGDEGIREHSVYVYVAESDEFRGFDTCIENNFLEYRGEKGVKLHSIVQNDRSERIVEVQWEWGEAMDTSLYKILYDGRAVEFTENLLENFLENGGLRVLIVLSDGTKEWLTIKVLPDLP